MRKFGKICALICTSICSLEVSATSTTDMAKTFSEKSTPLVSSKLTRSAEYIASAEEGARSALKAGMPSLAQAIIEDAMSIENLPEQKAKDLMLLLSDAYIAQGKFETAIKTMDNADMNDSENIIRLALIHIGLSNNSEAEDLLEKIEIEKVSKDMLSWLNVAKGYICYNKGDFSKALEFFKEAKTTVAEQFVLADIMVAENLCKLSDINTNQKNFVSLENTLRENVKLYFGTPTGFQFAKQLAHILFKQGKIDDAVEILTQQLEIELSPSIDKEEINIIIATNTKNIEEQKNKLQAILKGTISYDICEVAIAILAKNPKISDDERKKLLEELHKNAPAEILDRIFLESAKIAIKSYNLADAKKYAEIIINNYPNSKYKKDALRILAWTAFSSNAEKAPEYRLAASHLSALASLEDDKEKANELRLLSADCFFLNKDFITASKLYESLFNEMKDKRGRIINRAMEANINIDNLQNATKMLDLAYSDSNINDDDIWNAEWKLISYLREKNLTDKAKERIEYRIKNATRSKSLLIKMQWLSARMSEETGEIQKAITQCDNILSTLKSEGIKDAQTRKAVATNAMLMKARCLETINKIEGDDGALALYKKLREEYPMSDASKLSYLYQARAEGKRGNYAEAQQLCRILYELDTKSQYAYDAVMDSAIYAEKLATPEDYKSAIRMFEKLCDDFPNNPRNYYARLSQAGILRKINNFADAKKLYEEIINQYGSHPEIHLAYLGLGDCEQNLKPENAITIFEKIYALPNMPIAVKAESAHKCAIALEKKDRTKEANRYIWITSTELLSQKLTPVAKYWISKSLFKLANNLEKDKAMNDTHAVYEMIIKHDLPLRSIAEAKQKATKK